MRRIARLIVAASLAGAALISPGVGEAENPRWSVINFFDRSSDDEPYVVSSYQEDGAHVALICAPQKPKSEFLVGFVVASGDYSFPDGDVAVKWKIDESSSHVEIWEGRTSRSVSGVFSLGQSAYEMALNIASARDRITFENVGNTIAFDVEGANEPISLLLSLCGLAD